MAARARSWTVKSLFRGERRRHDLACPLWRASRSLTTVGRGRPLLYTYIPEPLDYERGLALQETLVGRRLTAKTRLLHAGHGSTTLGSSYDPGEVYSESDLREGSVPRAYLEAVASTDVLLLLQHQPVFTAGRRETAEQTTDEAKRLTALGAKYCNIARGGLTTFHGPGQLVGYPIVDIAASQLRTRAFVEKLEHVLRLLVRSHGIETVSSEHTGVWVSSRRKIASIGLQVRQAITNHGFALNVQDDVLPWFAMILACGIQGAEMTSMNREMHAEATFDASNAVPSSPSPSPAASRTIPLVVPDVVPSLVRLYGQVYERPMVRLGEEDFPDGGIGRVISSALGGVDFSKEAVRVAS